MNELLIGKWQAYKFSINGKDTWYDKGKGLLFQIHPDGKVDYAHYWKGQWSKDAIERRVVEGSKIIITEGGEPLYEVVNLTITEVEFHVIENFGKVVLVHWLRKIK